MSKEDVISRVDTLAPPRVYEVKISDKISGKVISSVEFEATLEGLHAILEALYCVARVGGNEVTVTDGTGLGHTR